VTWCCSGKIPPQFFLSQNIRTLNCLNASKKVWQNVQKSSNWKEKRVRTPPVLPSQNDPESASDIDDPPQSDPHFVPSSVVESSSDEDDERVEEVADESSRAGSQESQQTPADHDDDDDDDEVVLVGV
jgi:hypothetical protein